MLHKHIFMEYNNSNVFFQFNILFNTLIFSEVVYYRRLVI